MLTNCIALWLNGLIVGIVFFCNTIFPVNAGLLVYYQQDSQFRMVFQETIKQRWLTKDNELAKALAKQDFQEIIESKEIRLP